MDGFHQFGDAGPGKAIAGHRFETSWFWRVLPSGMRRRWWLFRLFDLIARHWPLFGERSGALIVRMDGIGDMVLFRRCLDHYADVLGLGPNQITILGCKSWDKVAVEIFAGYRLFMIDEHAFARQPFYRFKIALMVRRLAPMVTICDSYLRRAMMADSLVWVASAPTSLVSLPFINEPTRTEFTYYLSQVDRIIDTGPYPTHEVVRHSRFLTELAGREIPPLAPRIPWREKLPEIAARGAYAVLNPGSNEYGRRWPHDCYLDIAENLLARGLRVVIVGGPGERPGDYRARLGDDARINDLIGATSMPELLDILKHARRRWWWSAAAISAVSCLTPRKRARPTPVSSSRKCPVTIASGAATGGPAATMCSPASAPFRLMRCGPRHRPFWPPMTMGND
jgi:hypothetical protein